MADEEQLVAFVRGKLEQEAEAGAAVRAAIAAYARRMAFRRRWARRLSVWAAAAILTVACAWSVHTVNLARGEERLRAALVLFDAASGEASSAELVLAFQDAPSEWALASAAGDSVAL